MIILLSTRSFTLAWLTDYPGLAAAKWATWWIQYRGIAPPTPLIWTINLWAVLTSAVEWIAIGLAMQTVARRAYKMTFAFEVGDKSR